MIRNLPQLQKLDNVVVQPDEVADSMRRGIELIHPYDQDESIPYTNYAPPGPPSFQQQAPQQVRHDAKITLAQAHKALLGDDIAEFFCLSVKLSA